jgi:hypothetical protein
MAAITITAANVAPSGTSYNTETGTAGASITAGQPLYKDTGDANKLKLADANASSLTATVAGIALHAAASGQPITYQNSGSISIGATVVAGTIYVAGATAGEINPASDLTTGWRTSILGVATSSSVIRLNIFNSDTAN